MQKTTALLLFLLFCASAFSQSINYKTGDVLHVFTAGGLKLRETPALDGKVVTSMKLGDKVAVLELPDVKNLQTIEGITGNWTKVKYGTMQGFAFDGFLSSLPVPRADLMKNVRKIAPEALDPQDRGYEMDDALEEYIKAEFPAVCEPVEYYNGADGEGFQHLEIQKTARGFTKTVLHGWEGYSRELLMPGVRLSEVQNLIVLLAIRSGVDNALLEEIKNGVKNALDRGRGIQDVLSLDMFWIKIKQYSPNPNEKKWSIEFSSASS